MSVNEDFVQSSSDSFWEPGKYMRTVKRSDNGQFLCINLRKLIEERAELERKYSSSLLDWTKRWNSFLDKGPEYGTTQGAWRGVLTEAEQVADLHTAMADKLMANVYALIKGWQKDNYHKSMMHFRETKEFEDNFRKVQKPWGKRLSKVMAMKKEYHAACRAEKSMANQENNARGDTTVSHDQLTKLQEKLRKCQREVETAQEKYNSALVDLNDYNPKYIEEMTEVYNKCQEFEQKRIEFFKEALFKTHDCLNLSENDRYKQIYQSLHSTITNQDAAKDLKWWSANHGVEMHMNWPEFEEYSPGLQSITKRGKSNVTSADGGIMITKIKHAREDSYGSYTNEQPQQPPAGGREDQQPPPQQTYNSHVASNDRRESYSKSLNPFGDDEDEEEEEVEEKSVQDSKSKEDPTKAKEIQEDKQTPAKESDKQHEKYSYHQMYRPHHEPVLNNGSSDNPFDEPDNDFNGQNSSEDSPTDGWMVRALYSYAHADDDELDLNVGDVFKQTAEADEMGWCKGIKNGVEGFFPTNYVERI